MRKKINLNIDSVVVQNRDIDVSDLNNEKVMMNIDKGQYFSLNSLGSRIWELIDSPKKISDVIHTLLEEFEVSEEECIESVTEFLNTLHHVELIDVN